MSRQDLVERIEALERFCEQVPLVYQISENTNIHGYGEAQDDTNTLSWEADGSPVVTPTGYILVAPWQFSVADGFELVLAWGQASWEKDYTSGSLVSRQHISASVAEMEFYDEVGGGANYPQAYGDSNDGTGTGSLALSISGWTISQSWTGGVCTVNCSFGGISGGVMSGTIFGPYKMKKTGT